eukprot:3037517-Pyramimonas_sp.AAC.1
MSAPRPPGGPTPWTSSRSMRSSSLMSPLGVATAHRDGAERAPSSRSRHGGCPSCRARTRYP